MEGTIHSLQLFKCEKCNKEFEKKKNLLKHMDLHNGTKNYKCPQCDKIYSRSDHLKRHSISHNDNPVDRKPYQCPECVKRFSNGSHLNRHVKNIHSPKNSFEFKCEKCEEIFNKKRKLSKHFLIKHGEEKSNNYEHFRKHRCYYPFCHRKFYSKGRLDNHISRFHSYNNDKSNDSNYVLCPYEGCLKTYSKMWNLKVHIKTFHYKIEEFVCNLCSIPTKFKYKKTLESHYLKNHPEIYNSDLSLSLSLSNELISDSVLVNSN